MRTKIQVTIMLACSLFTNPIFAEQSENNHQWHPEKKLGRLTGFEFDSLGRSVSVSGRFMLVGTPEASITRVNEGIVTVYSHRGQSGWSNDKDILSPHPGEDDWFGYSVDLKGTRGIIGAPLDDFDERENRGKAHIVERINGDWILTATLHANEYYGGLLKRFGWSVGIDGDTALIGAPGPRSGQVGAAYIFELINGQWVKTQKLIPTSNHWDDKYGYSVSISGDRAVIGSMFNDLTGEKDGAVFVFKRSDLINERQRWIQEAVLIPDENSIRDCFGTSVDIQGDRILIGAECSQFVYVYELKENGSWVNTAKLEGNEYTQNGLFGTSVELSNNYAFVSSAFSYYNVEEAIGSVSAFLLDSNSNWRRVGTLKSPAERNLYKFGVGLSASGNTLVIGSPHENNNHHSDGAAYIYKIDHFFGNGFE